MSVRDSLRERFEPVTLGVPGPTSLDMARAFRSVRRDPLSFLSAVTDRFGDTVSFPLPGFPVLLLNDPDDVQHVLQGAGRNWSKHTVQYASLARITGPGLLASAESSWIDHRRVAAPAFHRERLEAVSAQVRAAADDAVAARLRPGVLTSGSVVDLAEVTHRIGLDAVGRALFSADLSDQAKQLLTATSEASDLVVRLGRSMVPTAKRAPTPTNARLLVVRRRLTSLAAQLVEQRRRRGAAGLGATSGDDLLGLMLDSGMSDRQIGDELITMVVAGHETVAAALAWTLMLLAEHPQAQERLRRELAAHPGPVSLLSHRNTVPWTRAVIDEALRLYPPAWALSRRSRGEDVVAGRTVPAGTLAIMSPWLVHRRADRWPDPLRFDPERFLDGTPREAYLPFGQGPRLCIGREFALGEMVMVLERLLREHRVSVPDGWTRPLAHTTVAVHPRGGMPLVVTATAGDAPGGTG